MQTINLEFKQLDKLPVPTDKTEILIELTAKGRVYSHFVWSEKDALVWASIAEVQSDCTYAHVKVSETPQFKVGDRVKWSNGNGLIIDVVEADKLAEILWNKNGVTVVVLLYFKDLNILSDFKVGDKVLYKAQQGYTIHRIDTNTNTCLLIQPIIRGMLQANLTDLTLITNE